VDEVALLEGLNEAQRHAVTTASQPLCILAGAGSGKTRVLTRRIAHRCAAGTADAGHVLALTFTRKAAGELTSRLRALGLRDRVVAGTFHAVAYAQLRTLWADRGVRPPGLLERKSHILARLLPRNRTRTPTTVFDVAAEIEWAKARMVSPERYGVEAAAAGRRAPQGVDDVGAVYRRYEDEKRSRRVVDFDDLLLLAAREIGRDTSYAAAQRWRFRHLFVDEYQDVNALQHALLEAWRGDRLDLCVVGDPNQAIYAWNGADARHLTQFASAFPGAEVTRLDENYRSSPQIIAVANAVLAAGETDAAPTGRLRATRSDGPIPRVRSYADDRAEANGVARAVLDQHRPGVPWSHQAVLVRTNAQGVLLEQSFRRVGIPFRLRGRGAFLELPEVKEVLRRLERAPSFGGGLADIDAAVRAGLAGSADDVDDGSGPGREGAVPAAELDRLRNLEEVLRLAGEYQAADSQPTADGFGAWLAATVRAEDAHRGGDAVDIATFHAAKGLEWPVVHLAGLEAGLVPIGHAKSSEALAEERRLFYVAVTRAERLLLCSWAERRTFGTRTSNRSQSPFLDEVEQVIAALEAGAEPGDWRVHVARQRTKLQQAAPRAGVAAVARLDGDGRAIFEALKQWRASLAKAAKAPAYTIFHDSTLAALADRRPRTTRELLAVPGVGPVKASRFGDDVLALVASAQAE
jgi:DNA helicase-2/ATP-dependent DNA helicase PcrA